MFINLQTIVYFVFVTFILSLNGNAVVHRLKITVPDNDTTVKERFSLDNSGNNGSIVSRGVINHVRHKHEQTVGNVHILTNIDIANLITILNTSALIPGSSAEAPSVTTTTVTAPGKLCE